jgi:hypothetical protein
MPCSRSRQRKDNRSRWEELINRDVPSLLGRYPPPLSRSFAYQTPRSLTPSLSNQPRHLLKMRFNVAAAAVMAFMAQAVSAQVVVVAAPATNVTIVSNTNVTIASDTFITVLTGKEFDSPSPDT